MNSSFNRRRGRWVMVAFAAAAFAAPAAQARHAPGEDPATAPFNHSAQARFAEESLAVGPAVLAALALDRLGDGG